MLTDKNLLPQTASTRRDTWTRTHTTRTHRRHTQLCTDVHTRSCASPHRDTRIFTQPKRRTWAELPNASTFCNSRGSWQRIGARSSQAAHLHTGFDVDTRDTGGGNDPIIISIIMKFGIGWICVHKGISFVAWRGQ